jgi:hypothetical protein
MSHPGAGSPAKKFGTPGEKGLPAVFNCLEGSVTPAKAWVQAVFLDFGFRPE